jgi:hypothetical protein
MKTTFYLLFWIAFSASVAHALECGPLQEAYDRLNQQILVHNNEDARLITPELIINTRPKLQTIVENAVRSMLHSGSVSTAAKLREEIQCIQGRARSEEENPDLPYVIQIGDTNNPRYLIVYVINAGGSGIPDSIPSVGLWVRQTDGWQVHYLDMSFYQRSSLTLNSIYSDHDSTRKFLFYGKEYGDSQSRLKLLLIEVHGNDIQQIWKAFDYSAGTVSIDGNQIHISYLPSRKTETYKKIVYVVSANGVHEVKQQPAQRSNSKNDN